jgi:hypothetical protein
MPEHLRAVLQRGLALEAKNRANKKYSGMAHKREGGKTFTFKDVMQMDTCPDDFVITSKNGRVYMTSPTLPLFTGALEPVTSVEVRTKRWKNDKRLTFAFYVGSSDGHKHPAALVCMHSTGGSRFQAEYLDLDDRKPEIVQPESSLRHFLVTGVVAASIHA